MKKFLSMLLMLVMVLVFNSALAESWDVVTGDYVRVRSSPETTSDDNIIGKLFHGTPIDVIENLDNWVYIEYDTQRAYVSADYVQHIVLPDEKVKLGVTTTGVNLRTGPDTTYQSLGVISGGTTVYITGLDGVWYSVKVDGKEGYMHSDYVEDMHIGGIILGQYTTSFNASKHGRCENIKKAAGLMNGAIVAPGETFSILSLIGPVTKEAGYQEAPEFRQTSSGVETVTGYGGGICQVATTLYNAVRCASENDYCTLRITERRQHSKKVGYVPTGMDATISWNAKQDFQFVNENPYVVRVISFVQGGTITCMIMH